MIPIWVITERESNADSLLANGFSTSVPLRTDNIHISLSHKLVFNLFPEEEDMAQDVRIPAFNRDKYTQLTLLTSLGFSIRDALKELT